MSGTTAYSTPGYCLATYSPFSFERTVARTRKPALRSASSVVLRVRLVGRRGETHVPRKPEAPVTRMREPELQAGIWWCCWRLTLLW